MNLWQLRRIATNENLNDPQPLPENWKGIFGLSGITDKIGDLTWTGDPELAGVGWFDTGIATPSNEPVPGMTKEEEVKATARALLTESDWAMQPDVPMTNGEKTKWIEYRKALREIKLQANFPNVTWPAKP